MAEAFLVRRGENFDFGDVNLYGINLGTPNTATFQIPTSIDLKYITGYIIIRNQTKFYLFDKNGVLKQTVNPTSSTGIESTKIESSDIVIEINSNNKATVKNENFNGNSVSVYILYK